jgi:hypothetical protein
LLGPSVFALGVASLLGWQLFYGRRAALSALAHASAAGPIGHEAH